MTKEDFQKTVRAYKDKHGHFALSQLLLRIAGTRAISEVPESKFAEIVAACAKEPPESDRVSDFEGPTGHVPKSFEEIDAAQVWAHWNSFKRRS